jgi:pectinesterase
MRPVTGVQVCDARNAAQSAGAGSITMVITLMILFCICWMNAAAQQAYLKNIVVAQDGSGNFRTIQDAVNAVRDHSDRERAVTIHIRKGVYKEKIVIPSWKTNIRLVGESKESTIISWDDFSGKPNPGGTDAYKLPKFSTYTSYTVLVQGNDIVMDSLTIENTAGRVGQAVALHVEGDRFVIRNSNILGNQDTLYATKAGSRQYYENCLIAGTTDFIFGEAIALFMNCTIKSFTNSFITAASTRQGQSFGYVFIGCKLVADTAAKKVFLGRPWRPYAKTVFIDCDMGSHIVPQGWDPWKGDTMFTDKEKTAYYGEYNSKGEGAAMTQRVGWSHILTRKETSKYTVANIFKDWNPI